ncbi:DUF3187 family protein [bacterium]|nr:DUF3187 family protein [bacterium]
MRQTRAAVALACCAVTAPALASNPAAHPYTIQNESTLAIVHGLPRFGDTLQPAIGKGGFSASLDWTNDYTSSAEGNEAIVLDAETLHLRLRAAANWGGWLASATLPLISHDEGVLDSSIDSWHDLTGLPTGGREDAPRDRFLVRYVRDGEVLLNFDDTTSADGIGDVVLSLGRQYENTVVRFEVKLPTGEAESLTGSGGASGSVVVESNRQISPAWYSFGGIAITALEGGDWLPGLQRNVVGSALAGVSASLSDSVAAKLQLNAHSPLYEDSDLDQLRRSAVLISTGLSWAASERCLLDVALVENLTSRVAPDVGLHLNLRTVWQ